MEKLNVPPLFNVMAEPQSYVVHLLKDIRCTKALKIRYTLMDCSLVDIH